MYSDIFLSLIAKINITSLAFILLSGLVVYVLFQVQKREDFDFAEMLKSNGKPSASRLGMLLSLVISSFIVLQVAFAELSNLSPNSPARLVDVLGLYLGVFAGAKVLEKGIDAWKGSADRRDFPSRQDFRPTTQPDFEDTVPMDMQEVLGHR